MRLLFAAMRPWGALVVVVLLAGCSSSGKTVTHPSRVTSSASSSSPTALIGVIGTVSLTSPDGWESGGDLTVGAACRGTGGYSDINDGAEVVISDDAGKTLVISSLTGGTLTASYQCQFDLSAVVPAGLGFYGVTVTHRGTVKEAEADLGSVALTLGS